MAFNPMYRLAVSAILAFAAWGCAAKINPSLGVESEVASKPGKRKSSAEMAYVEEVKAAIRLGYDNQSVAADLALTSVIERPAFEQLPAAIRREALSLAAYAAIDLEQIQRAHGLALQAIAVDPETPSDWLLLSYIEGALGNAEFAAQRLTHFARKWPKQVNDIELSRLSNVMAGPKPGSPARLQLLQAMFDAGFAPDGGDMSYYWHELALLHVLNGSRERAAEVIPQLTSPMVLVMLRSDRRFDALIDATSAQFDVERAAAKQVITLRERAALAPDNLRHLTDLLSALMLVGDHQEVLDITAHTLATVAADPTRSDAAESVDELNWTHNLRASAFMRLGRLDDALAQMVLASQLHEEGNANVSQVLNLAGYYSMLDRHDEALATAAKVGGMSGYGRLVLESIRYKAALARLDQATADAAIAHIRQHFQLGPMILVEALLSTDQTDEAAKVMIAMLASEHERDDALLVLQEFRELPPTVPALQRSRERWQKLRQHPELRKAVNAVGRIHRYSIYGE